MSRRAWLAAILSTGACFSAAAGGGLSGNGCDDLRGSPIVFRVDWQTQIKPLFNEMVSAQGRCTSCHNDAALQPDLTDLGIDAIFKIVPAYVVPGDPRASQLFDKLNCENPGSGGARMPLGNTLSLEEQGLIHDWIAQGALGEPEDEPPIPRDFLFRDGLESLR